MSAGIFIAIPAEEACQNFDGACTRFKVYSLGNSQAYFSHQAS